jgi:hypothetical protein
MRLNWLSRHSISLPKLAAIATTKEQAMGTPGIRARRVLAYVSAAVVALGSAGAAPASEAQADQAAAACARQFEAAQRTDMESFRDYDAETFRAVHHPDAATVFASGAVRYGIDAIMAALEPHFTNREAIWAWTELYRVVDGCKSAFILYDTTYDIPSVGFHQHALVGVTYTHVRNEWLAVADQGTLLP